MNAIWRLTDMDKRDGIKRRLNFISGEDFYFLTYELLLLIDILTAANGMFRDHRKLSYLVQLAGDEKVVRILERYEDRTISNAEDREQLFVTFANGELNKREIFKLVFALERRGFLRVERAATPEVVDVQLNRSVLPADFLINEVFGADRARISRIRKVVPRLSTLTMDTFLQKVYESRGVNVWAL
ncbi:hypothetical protein BamMC406_5327 [Burkholderia ambifaria MC40-6]|uniref:Uncharacterized protein n=2 Tax=Burkholderia ambifaria TaxID=152480 RepID=B1Z1R6_BURA4|nr:hypothetical protein BamMC406_5327 [Burkholderia ambifaria MC40-6]